ncbi:MAG: RnfABCDGE type electron transport complex subunit D [Candidatus Hydrogenedentes bacterium]|nr:RnfABCDGE type electron transport complex subunit D [Candidatus Hydrogenedentota bacterium]
MNYEQLTGIEYSTRRAAVDAPRLRNDNCSAGYSRVECPAFFTTGAVRWNRLDEARRVVRAAPVRSVLSLEPAAMARLRPPLALKIIFALTPVVVYSVLALGMSALLLILTATLACVLTEHLICRITGKTTTIYNSAGFAGVFFSPGESRALLYPCFAESPLVLPLT